MDNPPNKKQRHFSPDIDNNKNNASSSSLLLLKTSPDHHRNGPRTIFTKPREVGCFSINGQGQFINDEGLSQARSYHPLPPNRMGVSLRQGYDKFVPKQQKEDDEREGLDNLLKWLLSHSSDESMGCDNDVNAGQRPIPYDFVTWRGHLTKIMCTPFESCNAWQMAVRMHRDTIYMSEWETDTNKRTMDERGKAMCYWGYRFEGYATTKLGGEDGSPPDGDVVINPNEQYCSVVTTAIDSHTVLLSGEVDCMDNHNNNHGGDKSSSSSLLPPLGKREYIELKTNRVIQNQRQRSSFERHKLKKFWAQSFLLNVPRVVVGFRDDDGIVKTLQTFRTLDIPNMIHSRNDNRNSWNVPVCLGFLRKFLDLVKVECGKKVDVTLMCTFDPERGVITIREDHDDKYAFLPDWYIQGLPP